MNKLLSVILLVSLLASCNKNDFKTNEEIFADDQAAIKAYLTKEKITAQVTTEGVHYVITTEGTGNLITPSNTVSVNYKGYLLDGTQFDNSNGKPFVTKMTGGVIDGWKVGLLKFKKGSKGRIFIPSALGYGTRGAGADIPPNTPIAFDIDVVEVN
jgi:FKBP-type peptidyl-prolyl cis-trans isomerase FkpA